jgi:hypothetical protein
VTLSIPMRLPSASNLREPWQARHRRVKLQRRIVAVCLTGRPAPALPVVVTMERIAPRALDDDNLRGAFKAVRDELARWLGVADNHPDVTWAYGQRRGGVGEYAVDVRVEAA